MIPYKLWLLKNISGPDKTTSWDFYTEMFYKWKKDIYGI